MFLVLPRPLDGIGYSPHLFEEFSCEVLCVAGDFTNADRNKARHPLNAPANEFDTFAHVSEESDSIQSFELSRFLLVVGTVLQHGFEVCDTAFPKHPESAAECEGNSTGRHGSQAAAESADNSFCEFPHCPEVGVYFRKFRCVGCSADGGTSGTAHNAHVFCCWPDVFAPCAPEPTLLWLGSNGCRDRDYRDIRCGGKGCCPAFS